MFSENPLTSIALVLAILAYVGAVRLAIEQQLGSIKSDLDNETDNTKYHALWKRARKHSGAIRSLMFADIFFIGIGIMLVISQFLLSRVNPINVAFMVGALYLIYLHGSQWVLAYEPSTRDWNLPSSQNGAEEVGPFCTTGKYVATAVIPLLMVMALAGWLLSDKHLVPRDAEAHYQLGRELYEQGRFDAAIVQHRHAIRIDSASPRYHYALAKALASKKARYAPLAALKHAVENDADFRKKARSEPAFDAIRDGPGFRKLVPDE